MLTRLSFLKLMGDSPTGWCEAAMRNIRQLRHFLCG
jgi:hypothetical protein